MFDSITGPARALIISALALLVLIATACASDPTPAPTATAIPPTPNIEATVRAAISATSEVPATIRAAVAATLEAIPTQPPVAAPTVAAVETKTPVPTAIPTRIPTPTVAPTLPPTSTPVPVPVATPTPLPTPTPKTMPIFALPSTPKPTAAAAALSVAPIEAIAGETQQLQPIFEDEKGNVISGGKVTWTILDSNAGSIDSSGMLIVGEVAGSFEGAVEARASDASLVATATVTISPGPLDQVGIAPDSAAIGTEMSQQFVAAGADKFGNRIRGLKFSWRLETGGGTLGAGGLFTAGPEAGMYADTVKVTASQGNEVKVSTTSVSVEPDRIAFLSKRNAEKLTDTPNLYVMNSDGSSVIQITKNGAIDPSWSPDGRRIVYDQGEVLYAINAEENLVEADVDNWRISLLSERFRADDPVWSPDGTKIVFQSFEHADDAEDDAGSEIYVMDIDGGNRVRLTDNTYRDDKPSWSPDGSKIVFISDSEKDGKEQIYVIDEDGSNLRQLTNGGQNDQPEWSPDGTEIVYESRPGKGDWWRIDVIDARTTIGSGRILTFSSTNDYVPTWSPDSEHVLFSSFRDSEFRSEKTSEERDKGAEIYIMERSGRNVRRLTNNEAWDGFPVWAPRRAGVEVGDSSVIFPNASSLIPRSVREVTERARTAVVRIKTDLGSGSGFIIGSDGIILTNNHVIQDTQEIIVFLEDGTDYPGTILGRDMVRDLAKIKIESSELPFLAFGDLSNVSLGQQIVSLGFPLGNTSLSVTSGFISSILFDPGRNIMFIQMDSNINSGNSGGPLLNLQGQVVGVVSSRVVGTNVEGLGRAISANTIGTYLDLLQEREIIKPPEVSQTAQIRNSFTALNIPLDVIAVDQSGNVYVADTANHRVQKFSVSSQFITEWGTQGTGDGQFDSPGGISVDGDGRVYVADTGNHRIQKFTANGLFLSSWGTQGTGSGEFNFPGAIVADRFGNFFVADTGNHRIQQFNRLGVSRTRWGIRGKGDGQFISPGGIALDKDENVYVADTGNNRIQKCSHAGEFIASIAEAGNSSGQLNAPVGVEVDSLRRVFVADSGNHRIQIFDGSGQGFIFMFGSEGIGEGQFNTPGGISLDSRGNLFIADTKNHRIQAASPNGVFFRNWGSKGDGDGEFQWTS